MLKRAVSYFGIVFGVGFALGVVRVTWLVPAIGERYAELAESPLMFVAIVLAARFVVRKFPADKPGELLVSGGLALLLLLDVEFTVVLWLRGLSVSEYFASSDPVAGSVYALMLVLFALMPYVVGRRSAR